jgi:hypothetical protein
MTVCDECGGELRVGDWPFCRGRASAHAPGRGFGFDPFTPYVDPHILPHGDPRACHETVTPQGLKVRGTLIESREQRRHIMKEQNLDWAPRPYGEGGSEV